MLIWKGYGHYGRIFIMRTLWTGTLGFGLVNIPVNLYSGVQEHNVDLDMLHGKDLAPIRYAKVCTEEGEEVSHDEIVKGFQYEEGKYVVLTKEDFIAADVKQTKTLEIVAFTDEASIDPIYFEKFYYLEPGKGGDKAYALLRDALSQSKQAGVVQFVLRERSHIGIVRVSNGMLLLNQMRYADEIRDPSSLNIPKEGGSKKEVDLALSLIKNLSNEFNIEDYHDTYEDALKQLIADKVKGKKPSKASAKTAEKSNVRSLMALLEASIDNKPSKKPATKKKTSSRKRVS